jgi:hypothetical protein
MGTLRNLRLSRLNVLALTLFLATFTGCDHFTHIKGIVQDSRGKPIADVTVKLTNGSRAMQYQSDEDGSFLVEISDSPFKTELVLSATKYGYKPFEKRFYNTENLQSALITLEEINPSAKPRADARR